MRDSTALMTRSIHLYRHSVLTVSVIALVDCPITSAQIGLVINNHVQEFCYSYDQKCNFLVLSILHKMISNWLRLYCQDR